MKILIAAPRFVPGKTYGAEVYFINMLAGLLRLKDVRDEVIVATNTETAPWMAKTFTSGQTCLGDIKVAALSVPQNTMKAIAYEQWALPSLTQQTGADVVFFPFNLMPAFGISSGKQRTGSVLMVHDLVSHFYRTHFPKYRPIFNRMQSLLLRASIARAGAIITPTQAMADDLSAAFPRVAGKISAIHEAASNFTEGHSKTELPEAWQGARHLLMQSGAKLPHKSQNTSLEALAILKQEAPELYADIRLVITGGEVSDKAKLSKAIEAYGIQDAVTVAGRVPRPALEALASQATLHLFPTLYEGFGLGIVEALALGKNFVASDLPVLREVSEGQGLFFKPGNAAAMADTLKQALVEPQAPTRAPEWSWDDHGRVLLTILRSQAGV